MLCKLYFILTLTTCFSLRLYLGCRQLLLKGDCYVGASLLTLRNNAERRLVKMDVSLEAVRKEATMKSRCFKLSRKLRRKLARKVSPQALVNYRIFLSVSCY
ncbi:hypothetical protein C8J55DRAFT_140529 [Lentinula edodes]|uniref:Uncharacterized protein n=1 Tax=Lentinula lateritia TaxID=40482 RepID=A0A9W9A3K6_9AGAR|nr:hypothetical protein C8J55DRAFT_140529 [Lentinula edodes]